MNSINLLPKEIVHRNNILKQRIIIILASVSIYAIIIVSYSFFYADYVMSDLQLTAAKAQLDSIDQVIMKKIEEQRTPVEEEKIKKIISLLNVHPYFSKAFEHINSILSKNVYLMSGDFSIPDEQNVVFKFNAKAKDYRSAMEQISLFKEDYWINDVRVGTFSGNEGNEISFDGSLALKREIISYHDNYWEYGLALIDTNKDGSIKLTNYSAETAKTDNGTTINVKFDGIAYNVEKIKEFEDLIKNSSKFIKEVKVNFDEKKSVDAAVIEFNGTAKIVLDN